jgi:hypothetical protein
MPIPRLAKYPRIRLLEYALSAATLKGKRLGLGLPLPGFLMAPPSINFSNTVDSCASPGVSSKTTGLPLPSHRTCILVENPPWLRPSASSLGSTGSSVLGSPFLPQLHAGEHVRRSYLRSGFPTQQVLWYRHLSAPQQGFGPRCLPYASDRSGRTLFCRSRIAQANPPKEHLFS